MGIQIIGTKKCKDTMKAIRFCKERGIDHQFVDLTQRALSRGELESIAAHLGADNLLDPESKEYKKRGLAHMVFDPLEELEEHPELLKTPVIRTRGRAVSGFDPGTLEAFLDGQNG